MSVLVSGLERSTQKFGESLSEYLGIERLAWRLTQLPSKRHATGQPILQGGLFAYSFIHSRV